MKIDIARNKLIATVPSTASVGNLSLPTTVKLRERTSAKDVLNLLAQMGIQAKATNVGYNGRVYTYLLHTNTKAEQRLVKDLNALAASY